MVGDDEQHRDARPGPRAGRGRGAPAAIGQRRHGLRTRRDGQRGDALAAPDEAHPLAGRGLDVDVLGRRRRAPSASEARIASRCGRELRALHDDRRVDVGDAQPALGERRRRRARSSAHRVGVAVALVGVGEVLADVAQPGGAEQRVDDRVGQHVGVGVAVEAAGRAGSRRRRGSAGGPAARRCESQPMPVTRGHPIGSRRRSRPLEDGELGDAEAPRAARAPGRSRGRGRSGAWASLDSAIGLPASSTISRNARAG